MYCTHKIFGLILNFLNVISWLFLSSASMFLILSFLCLYYIFLNLTLNLTGKFPSGRVSNTGSIWLLIFLTFKINFRVKPSDLGEIWGDKYLVIFPTSSMASASLDFSVIFLDQFLIIYIWIGIIC